ncbi:MAG: hypothetical protein ACM31O_01680 [Bacteroidota bacterium]
MPFDFPLTAPNLDEIPEEFRSLYVPEKEGEDSVTLIPDLKKRVEATTGLHKGLDIERKARSAAEKAAKAWKEAAGVDTPEALKARFEEMTTEFEAKLAEATKVNDKGGPTDVDIEKRISQVREEKDREWSKKLRAEEEARKKAEAERDEMSKSLELDMKERHALEAIVANKGRPLLLKRIVMDSLRVKRTENGRYAVVVVDEDGDERYDGDGKPMSVTNLVAHMRQSDDYAAAFEGDGASGSGSRTPSGGSRPKTNPWLKGPTFNATEQARLLKQNPQLAQQLKAQAEAEMRK